MIASHSIAIGEPAPTYPTVSTPSSIGESRILNAVKTIFKSSFFPTTLEQVFISTDVWLIVRSILSTMQAQGEATSKISSIVAGALGCGHGALIVGCGGVFAWKVQKALQTAWKEGDREGMNFSLKELLMAFSLVVVGLEIIQLKTSILQGKEDQTSEIEGLPSSALSLYISIFMRRMHSLLISCKFSKEILEKATIQERFESILKSSQNRNEFVRRVDSSSQENLQREFSSFKSDEIPVLLTQVETANHRQKIIAISWIMVALLGMSIMTLLLQNPDSPWVSPLSILSGLVFLTLDTPTLSESWVNLWGNPSQFLVSDSQELTEITIGQSHLSSETSSISSLDQRIDSGRLRQGLDLAGDELQIKEAKDDLAYLDLAR